MFDKFFKNYGDCFYVAFRAVVGLLFFVHGAQKFGFIGEGSVSGFAGIFGLPVWIAMLVALVELIGGLAILLGFFTRLSALGCAIVMIGAWFIANVPNGWNPMSNGGEMVLLYLMSFLVMIGYGARRWSLEKLLLKKEIF